MKANLCALLCSTVLLALGCYRSPMNKARPRPTAADAGLAVTPDARPASADLPLDLPRDGAPDLRPDLGRDLAQEVAREAGPELRDLGVERGSEAGRDLGGETAAAMCRRGEDYILVLGTDDSLYRFYPDTLVMVRIGETSCGTPGYSLNSLTVSPQGPAYISNNYGELCKVDLESFTATSTSFNAAAVSNQHYGMALVPDDAPAGQTLYIAVTFDGGNTLARVDLTNYAVTAVGPVVIRRDGGTESRPDVELTAGSNGELFGFSLGRTQSLLLTIDPETGEAIDVSQIPAGASNASFALVDWHGTLYVFLGNANDSVGAFVYTYRKGDVAVSSVGTLDVDILGAGVARCR